MKKLLNSLFILFTVLAVNAQTTITDDFESYADFTINPTSQWTFVDVDADSTYGFQGVTFPNSYNPMAFIVFNPNNTTPAVNAPAHSGDKYLACFASVTRPNNDWIISPDLGTTNGVNFTFWAKSQTTQYGAERIKVGYSTTTNATSAFTFVQPGNYISVPEAWTEYSFTLPVGTKYVAINCISDDAFILCIDDITIQPIGSEPLLTLDRATVNFGYHMLGNPAPVDSVNVLAYNITSTLTVDAPANFEVSSDNSSFGSTATLPNTGGSLYIRYETATLGSHTGDILIYPTNGTSVDTTISVIGNTIECTTITQYPYENGLEPSSGENLCWQIVDANGDARGNRGTITFREYTAGNYGAVYMLAPDTSTVHADDWLISPLLDVNAELAASFDYAVGYELWGGIIPIPYPETYSVWIIPADTNYQGAIPVVPSRTVSNYSALETQLIDLRPFQGQEVRVGIRVETPTLDGYYFIMDNFKVEPVTSSLTLVSSNNMDFGTTAAGVSRTMTASFEAVAIEDSIEATVSAPFELSYDGTIFASSILIPGDTNLNFTRNIIVRYSPTASGTHTATVIINSDATEDTLRINLTGSAIDCDAITEFPYSYTFNGNENACWSIFDDNNDGRTFSFNTTGGYAQYTYSAANPANDWLVSPLVSLPGNDTNIVLTFDYKVQSASLPEKFSVYVITDLNNHTNGTQILATQTINNTAWQALPLIDLSAYKGQDIYIGIKAESDIDQYYFMVRNFSLNIFGSDMEIQVDPEQMAFGSHSTGTASPAQTASVTAYNLSEDITITVNAPFQVSLDGTTYSDSIGIAVSGNIVTGTFRVRYNPTAAGNHTGTVMISSDTVTRQISLTGAAVDCSDALSLPFSEDFEGDAFLPSACWSNLDVDGDGYSWTRLSTEETGVPAHSGDKCVKSDSYINNVGAVSPNNYLVLPKLAIPTEGATLKWWIAAIDGDFPAEHYQVKISTTGNSPSNFTQLVFEETLTNDVWKENTVSLQNFAGQDIYIAFIHNDTRDEFALKMDDISVTKNIPDAIDDITIDHLVNVFPNPARHLINITAPATIESVEFYNMMGQQVLATRIGNDMQAEINTTDLTQGIYFVRIYTEKGMATKKITVVR